MLNNFCFHVYAQKSLSHSFNLSFTHSRHAEQVLFSCLGSKVAVYSRKLQCFFFDHIIIITLSPDIRVHRAGSQLKMSECQTKAGNQECFEKLEKLSLSLLSQLSLYHSLSLDMLNNFCFHVYAQKSLFKVENVNAFF